MMKKRLTLVALSLAAAAALAVAAGRLFPGPAYTVAVKVERARAGLEERSVDAGGLRISYLTGGKGEALVLLHGFGGNKDHWVRLAKYLGPHFRIIAPDLPGFGASTRDPGLDYSVGGQVERLEAFVQALGLKTFHIGGNSMGGAVAGVFAARHPEAVGSLWLLAPGGVQTARPSERAQLMAGGENVLVAKNAEEFDRLYALCFVNPPYVPGFVKRHLAASAAAGSDLLEKIYKDLMDRPVPLESALKGLPVPALILWGERDRITDVSGAAILESVMPRAGAIVMKDTGHLPMVENPGLTAGHYLEFQKTGIKEKG